MIHSYKKGVSTKLSDHFNSTEFDCKCKRPECDETLIDSDLIDYLEKKRTQIAKPLIVNSGYRCSDHNRAVGGKKGSFHLLGKAADLILKDEEIGRFYHLFQDADGLGNGWRFIHVDVRGYRSRWNY